MSPTYLIPITAFFVILFYYLYQLITVWKYLVYVLLMMFCPHPLKCALWEQGPCLSCLWSYPHCLKSSGYCTNICWTNESTKESIPHVPSDRVSRGRRQNMGGVKLHSQLDEEVKRSHMQTLLCGEDIGRSIKKKKMQVPKGMAHSYYMAERIFMPTVSPPHSEKGVSLTLFSSPIEA